MPSGDTKILEFNQYWKSDKISFIICADREHVAEKTDGSKNSRGNLPATNIFCHVFFSMSTISLFRRIENKHDVYRGKYCIKKFCEFLR